MEPSSVDHHQLRSERLRRLRRAEQLLDRWLDLFEQSLGEARPDATKTTEMANVFSICKRILEIEQLARKLQLLEEARLGNTEFQINPDLLLGRFHGGTEEDD